MYLRAVVHRAAIVCFAAKGSLRASFNQMFVDVAERSTHVAAIVGDLKCGLELFRVLRRIE